MSEPRAVNDRLYLNGVLEERTSDYYSQDGCGNVWYFGEGTAKEFARLEYFIRHPGEVLSRTRLVEHVRDSAYGRDLHVVNGYVAHLRDKIDRIFGRASLETVRGAGYRLHDDLAGAPTD